MSRRLIASLSLTVLLTCGAAASADEPMKSSAPGVMTCPKGVPGETTCYSGKDENGAFYVIAKPKNWNNMLVVTAHGGPSPFGDEKLSTSVALLARFSFIVREGFAWAGSSFRRGGFGVRMAAEDSENARRIFVQSFGRPKRTIIHGQSYGGGVAAKVAELYAVRPDGSRNYDGALLTSGVLAGGTRSYLARADMRAVYQYYCNNHPRPDEPQYPVWMGLPADSKLTIQELENRVHECTGIKMASAQRSERQRENLTNILNVTRTPERTLLINMDRATFLFQDIVHRRLSGRNPFSNAGVNYHGSSDDVALNRKVARFSSDAQAVAELAYDSDPTGKVNIPVLTMHAIDDPQIAVEVESIFRKTFENAGTARHLVQTFTDESEHARLSTPQYVTLLAALREWIESGRKPSPQGISDGCGAFSKVYNEPCRFAPSYQPKSYWSRVYPRMQ
jgi:alpha-beta hydrolase superfamily lysophospholipase